MEPASSGGSVNGNPSTEQLLKKIQQLEMLKISDEDRRHRQRSLSASPRRSKDPLGRRRTLKINDGGLGNSSSPLQRESFGLSERHHLRILQAMGQSVHVSDVEGRIIFWNRSAEHLFGFSATEALGQKANELIVDQCSFDLAADIESQVTKWGIWRGKLSVKNKRGEKFIAMTTNTPFYDDADGKLIGIICVSSDSRSFLESKLSNLATKVTNKGRSKGARMSLEGETTAVNSYPEHGCSDAASLDHKDDGASSGASTPRGDALPCPFITTSTIADKSPKKAPKFRSEETEGKMSIQNIISAKAEAWIAKKGISWPWKEQEHDADETKNRFVWPWLHHDPETDLSLSRNAESSVRQESQAAEITRAGNNEAMGSWSSSVSSCGSTNSSAIQKLDLETDCLDYEILWEDLVIGEQIGQGSCGTVYHALWYGSDVAVKVFSKMEYSEEVISSFKQEVSLMKRLRHPNILLFMGSVTSPQRLCIVTEFLPRGSLFQLLQRATTKLDWRRRVNMALDIARGVNYLHHCNPPIFHRDLKSSNLLVDKNWTVKVGDFGLSRLKRETYLTSNTGKGTPQWMAPEVLRNEHADEKSDVYSYGVVLWELVTEKIPWDNLNSMQVIGAVGFMNQRLELPEDLSPQWVSIISSCWHSEPNLRPSFQELIERLKDLQRHYSLQSQMQRSSHRKPPLE